MRKIFSPTAIAASLVLAFASPVSAEMSACPGVQGSAICALHNAAGEDGELKGADEAEALLRIMAVAGQVDQGERALLRMLLQASETGEPLSFDRGEAGTVSYAAPDREAAETIRYLTQLPEPAKALRDGDDAELQAIARYYSHEIGGLNSILEIGCAGLLHSVWIERQYDRSEADRYKPYRETIKVWWNRIEALDDADRSWGQRWLYACALQQDQVENDDVPDYFYDWLKP